MPPPKIPPPPPPPKSRLIHDGWSRPQKAPQPDPVAAFDAMAAELADPIVRVQDSAGDWWKVNVETGEAEPCMRWMKPPRLGFGNPPVIYR